MAVDEPRRSGRVRTQVKTYAEEQAEELATAASTKRKRPSAALKDDSEGQAEELATAAPSKSKRPAATYVDDSEDPGFSGEDEFSAEMIEEPPAKKKRSATTKKTTKKKAKKADDGMQAYGAPPAGTMIPWLSDGRMRRQPQVWELQKTKSTKGIDVKNFHAQAAEKRIAARLRDIEKLASGEEEYRLLDYVEDQDDLPDPYLSALDKANKEKMFVLDRVRDLHEDCHTNHEDCPCETLHVAGKTGNVYTVTISHLMTCTCPVAVFQKKGNETPCKHAIYVLHKILKAPGHLKYQQAYLTRELKELFAHAPRLPSEIAEETVKDGNRKEATGDCPICFEGFEEGDDLTWCRAACGNNLHAACFQQWERAKNPVTCPYCRSHWQGEEDAGGSKQKTTVTKVNMPTATGAGGYYNVKDQLDYD